MGHNQKETTLEPLGRDSNILPAKELTLEPWVKAALGSAQDPLSPLSLSLYCDGINPV